MPKHSNASLASRHPVHFKEYANQSARESATGFVDSDLYKFALQMDDKTMWILTSVSPVTWRALMNDDIDCGQW